MPYDLTSVSLPRLGSTGLAWLVRLAELGLTGPAVAARLKRDFGFRRLEGLDLDEPPTWLPAQPSDDPAIPPLDASGVDDGPYSDAPAPPAFAPGFQFPSVGDYRAAYRTGRLSPHDVAVRFLAQWRASDTGQRPLRAMIAVREDDLMAQADASATRWRAGAPLGPWDGVPVAIKDEVDVAGYPTTLGTRVLGRSPAARDSTVAARLRAGGAMLVGKANMHELGINVTGFNPHHGTPRNPYDDTCHTGGSSSGPAAAVASGLVPVAIGADGGGSIRIPTAFCGLVGLKPTFGRVSEHGAPPLVWSVAYLGPIAATARDCADAYALVAGDDAADPNSRGHPSVRIDIAAPRSLRGLRIGVCWPWFRHATPEVVARNEALLREFTRLGATLVEVDVPELDAARVAHAVVIVSEMAAAMDAHWDARRSALTYDARINLAVARSLRAREYVTAARVRTRAMAHWRALFRTVDVVATPATGLVAPPINPAWTPHGGTDLAMTTEIMRFATPANFTGHPAISFPAGYDARGLPIGMQVIGRPWSERLLLRVAAMAEQLVERRAPRRWHPTLDR